jgi:hypothetical protein
VRFYFAQADHPLRRDIPDLQTQAANDFHRMKRRRPGVLQLGYPVESLRQPVEGDARVQVVNVVVTDVSSEPCPDRTCFQKAGRFQRGLVVGPAGIVIERYSRKVVLGVKQVRTERRRD